MKRLLILLILLFALPAYAQQGSEDTQVARLSPAMMGSVPVGGTTYATPAHVQSVAAYSGSAAYIDIPSPGNVTTGNLLVVSIHYGGAGWGSRTETVSDTLLNTWTYIDRIGNEDTGWCRRAYTISGSSGANTIRVALSSSIASFACSWEFTNINATTPLDQVGSQIYTGATETNIETGSVTPSITKGVAVFSFGFVVYSGGTLQDNWTGKIDGEPGDAGAGGYQIISSTDAFTGHYHLAPTGNTLWTAQVTTFKAKEE